MSYCAADADLTWQIWNKAAMVDVGTCDDRFCLFAEGLTTTKKPTTGTQSSTTSSQGRLIDTFYLESKSYKLTGKRPLAPFQLLPQVLQLSRLVSVLMLSWLAMKPKDSALIVSMSKRALNIITIRSIRN